MQRFSNCLISSKINGNVNIMYWNIKQTHQFCVLKRFSNFSIGCDYVVCRLSSEISGVCNTERYINVYVTNIRNLYKMVMQQNNEFFQIANVRTLKKMKQILSNGKRSLQISVNNLTRNPSIFTLFNLSKTLGNMSPHTFVSFCGTACSE